MINIEQGSSFNMTSFFFNEYENTEGVSYVCNYNIMVSQGRHVRVHFLGMDISFPDTLFLGGYAFRGDEIPDDFISHDNELDILFLSKNPETRGFDLVISDYVEPGNCYERIHIIMKGSQ